MQTGTRSAVAVSSVEPERGRGSLLQLRLSLAPLLVPVRILMAFSASNFVTLVIAAMETAANTFMILTAPEQRQVWCRSRMDPAINSLRVACANGSLTANSVMTLLLPAVEEGAMTALRIVTFLLEAEAVVTIEAMTEMGMTLEVAMAVGAVGVEVAIQHMLLPMIGVMVAVTIVAMSLLLLPTLLLMLHTGAMPVMPVVGQLQADMTAEAEIPTAAALFPIVMVAMVEMSVARMAMMIAVLPQPTRLERAMVLLRLQCRPPIMMPHMHHTHHMHHMDQHQHQHHAAQEDTNDDPDPDPESEEIKTAHARRQKACCTQQTHRCPA